MTLAVSLILLLTQVGCHRGLVYSPSRLPPQYLAARTRSAQRLNLSRFARAGTNSQQIIPGDVLTISIATGMETEQSVHWPPIRVDEHGAVTVPLVGPVVIAGLELDDAEKRIRDESIGRAIYRAPNVSISLVERRRSRVTVVGAVLEPGIKELPASDCDLFAALVAAGGLTDDASTQVEIRRAQEQTSSVMPVSYQGAGAAPPAAQRECIDLAELERTAGETRLRDGDVVMVMPQPTRTVQVIGLVNTPSQIEMPADRDMRLLDAIAQAGGLTLQVANKVHVIRSVPEREEPVVIATTIRAAKSRANANVLLAAGDVVSVEETPATFTVEMLRSFIRFGFSSSIPGI